MKVRVLSPEEEQEFTYFLSEKMGYLDASEYTDDFNVVLLNDQFICVKGFENDETKERWHIVEVFGADESQEDYLKMGE